MPNCSLRVVSSHVLPVNSVRNLGIFLYSDTSMHTQTVGTCFGTLRMLRMIRHSVPSSVFRTLVSSLVLSRLDFDNAILFGLPDILLNRYQRVINTAARLIFGAARGDHITPLLMQLHWLRIAERIRFKVACLTWRCLNNSGPVYLAQDLHRASSSNTRQGLRSGSSANLIPPRTRNVTHGDRAWPVAAATVWNELPSSLKSETDYLVFRRKVKSHVWSSSFPL